MMAQTEHHNTVQWGREVETTVVRGNPCRVYTQRPTCMAALLQDARRWQERTFIVEGSRRLRFDEFEAAVARVAVQLKERSVGAGDRVVFLAYNSLEWITSFWAVHALGGIAVLCNAWWSAAESRDILNEVDATLILADQLAKRELLDRDNVIDIANVRTWVDASTPATLPALPAVAEDDLAIIMFTSGTTGRAKGALMSQRGVIANLHNLLALTGRLPNEIPANKPGTVSLLTVPLFHLAGLQVSISTLLSGGKLVLQEGRFDPGAVLRLIEQESVRVWGSIPTMVSRVLEHSDLARRDVSSLKSIPMGGAAISPELRAKVQQSFPSVQKSVGSLYGCTEAGGILAAGNANDVRDRPGCVGKPLPVVEIRIANPDAQGTGEIQARTPSAILGVWGDSTPIADANGWISTGDLGKLEDGYLYVSGRSKDIIIRAGENIACAHVEQCLLQHPAVQEAAVIPLPHADLGEEVAAVVMLREGHDASVDDLTAHTVKQLAKFEVPSRWWLRHEQLPVNATGKIDKNALKANWQGN